MNSELSDPAMLGPLGSRQERSPGVSCRDTGTQTWKLTIRDPALLGPGFSMQNPGMNRVGRGRTRVGVVAGGPALLSGSQHGLGGQCGEGRALARQLGQLIVPHMGQICSSSGLQLINLNSVARCVQKALGFGHSRNACPGLSRTSSQPDLEQSGAPAHGSGFSEGLRCFRV